MTTHFDLFKLITYPTHDLLIVPYQVIQQLSKSSDFPLSLVLAMTRRVILFHIQKNRRPSKSLNSLTFFLFVIFVQSLKPNSSLDFAPICTRSR